MAKCLHVAAAIAALIVSGKAHACAVVVSPDRTYADRWAEVRNTLKSATAILDGEVVEAEVPGQHPAKIRVHRSFKGPEAEFVYIEARTSCDIRFETVGEHWRFVLQGGPQVYSTWVDYSEARLIDRQLKSDRRKDWPLGPTLSR